MNDFEYAAPQTLQEATTLLKEHHDSVALLAGGTDILVQLREGHRHADLVMDVKRIPELNALEFRAGEGLVLGASTPCYRIAACADVSQHYPALADVVKLIGAWQIQSRASVGGNLCNASPAADSTPALIALSAQCRIDGPDGERTVPVTEFCISPGRNCMQPAELLVDLRFPAPMPHSGSSYLRFIPRNEMDIAVVGVGSWVRLNEAGDTIEDARIGLGAVAPTPVLASEAGEFLTGRPVNDETLKEAGEIAKRGIRPISDMRGTAAYRTHLVGVLTRRTLAIAIDRARA